MKKGKEQVYCKVNFWKDNNIINEIYYTPSKKNYDYPLSQIHCIAPGWARRKERFDAVVVIEEAGVTVYQEINGEDEWYFVFDIE